MKEKNRLDQLLDYARSEKSIVDTDRIEKLVASGKKVSAQKIKLGQARRGFINPLNLIIMFATITSIIAVIFALSSQPEKLSEHSFQSSDSSFVPGSSPGQAIRPSSFGGKEDSMGELSVISSQSSESEKKEVFVEPLVLDDVDPLLKDTLIIGEVIHLTQEELTRLGFLFNENGFFYLNKDDRGYLNFYSDRNPDSKIPANASSHGFSQMPRNQRKEITAFQFYPASITGIRGERLQDYSQGIESATRYSKAYYDDLSVPVYFPGRWFVDKKSSDKIIWFIVTDEFFDLLPYEKIEKAKERVDLVKALRAIPGNETKNYVEFDFMSHFSTKIAPVTLNHTVLNKLGLTVIKDRIVYRYQRDRGFLALTMHPQGSSFSAKEGAPANELDETRIYNSPLLGVTKIDGEFSVAVSTEFYPEISDTIEFFSNMYDVSIPVRFIDDSLPEIVYKSIFWFYPTEEFFNKLPDSIGIPMSKEFKVNVKPALEYGFSITKGVLISDTNVLSQKESVKSKPEEAVPCQYFPSFCEGLPGLDNLNVYPNPTSGELNLEILLSEGKTIDYRIFDLSGRLMVDDVERKKYDGAGQYNQKMDLGHLENGFYLLVLTDEGGARMTRRIVKN